MSQDSHYATTYFYLSAFLKAKGSRLVDIQRESRRTTFIFEDMKDRKELIKVKIEVPITKCPHCGYEMDIMKQEYKRKKERIEET